MLPLLARPSRLITATLVAFAALAGVAGSAGAATCGSKLCLDTTHSPNTAFVTQNSVVTYRVEVSNPGTSTATKVSLRFALDSRATLLSTPPTGCSSPDAANVITCTLGSVKPTGATPLVFLFSAQMPASAAVTSSTATLSSDARANDSGNNPNDPTVETFSDAPEVVEVRVIDGQAVSAIPDGLSVALNTDVDGSGATGSDKRTARFRLFPVGFSTTAVINDSVDDPGFVCPDKVKCPSGGWTESFIPGANGLTDPFVFPSVMEIQLVYDVSTLPSGLTKKSYVLLHDADYDANTKNYEQITRSCSSNPAPCLEDVFFNADGDLVVLALVTGNWRYR